MQSSLAFWKQIRWNLILYSVMLAGVPLIVVSAFTVTSNTRQDEKQVFNQLESVAELKIDQIERWTQESDNTINLVLTDPSIYNEIATVQADENMVLNAKLSGLAGAYPAFREIFIYDLDGNILAASNPLEVGKVVNRQSYFANSIAPDNAQRFHAPFYQVGTRELVLYSTYQIMGASGQIVRILAVDLDLSRLGEIMVERTGLPSTGETYLVSRQNNYLLTPSRFEGYPLTRAYRSVGIDEALLGENGSAVYDGYRGTPVLGVYSWIPELEAGLIAEVDQQEGLADAIQTRNTSLIATVVAILIAASFGLLYASYVSRPIMALTAAATAVTKGDYSQRVTVNRTNEIGQLTSAFNLMTGELDKNINDLKHLNEDLEERVKVRTHDLEIAREQSERANQVKSMFLASMSHELRTPLNSVINFTKFVAKGVMGPVNERQEETLNTVINSGKHLLNLINDVLDMSKIESGSLSLFVESNVNVNSIIQSATTTAQGLLGDKTVKLELDVEPDLPLMIGDRQRIYQVLLNMISNACKFTQEGHIKISAHQQNGNLQLAVADTGPGIAPEDQAAVFEPFKQTEAGLRQGGGTGLGMPISRSLVEAHNGRMWLESTPGKGSIFHVTLPIKSDTLVPSF